MQTDRQFAGSGRSIGVIAPIVVLWPKQRPAGQLQIMQQSLEDENRPHRTFSHKTTVNDRQNDRQSFPSRSLILHLADFCVFVRSLFDAIFRCYG